MTAASALSELQEILKTCDILRDPAEIEAVLRGVAAAPREAQDNWTDLMAPKADAATRQKMIAAGHRFIDALGTPFSDGPAPAERLQALRAEMRRLGLAGLVIPRTDEYQGEYIAQRAERVQWLTGFAGSAGTVVVGLDKAAIFVDGRYTLQVQSQVDTALFEPRHLVDEPATDWIAENFGPGDKIGFDPWLHTQHGAGHLNIAAKRAGAELVRVEPNPVDAVWTDQPAAPLSPVVPHDVAFAGESAEDKRRRLGKALDIDGIDAVAITATDSIAWLLNMRGGDVPNCPLPLSFALLHKDGAVDWFIDDRKLTPDAKSQLGNEIAVRPESAFPNALAELGRQGRTVQADPATAPCLVFDRLTQYGARTVEAPDPCLLPKACKNAVEIAGTRNAHRRDGAALSRFLHWIESDAAKGGQTELSAIERLRQFRAGGEHFRGLSFDTIAGAGPNGAVIHYRAGERTNRPIESGQLLLVDSGGQYLDGTTDVTRTVAVGTPTAEMKARFTLVLKGHIAIATARFPVGVSGSQLDPLARMPLWRAGLDFDHGTGHGVGSYLNVHEGPQRIAKAHNSVALRPGMILSNEPGYYKAGEYGIRIENLVVVREVSEPPAGAERKLLEFETITLAPIDRNLVDTALLTEAERAWLNLYHDRVRAEIAPQLDGDALAWLEAATAPL
ncbi:MAG: aminopeptidase P family protein [Pseudomonadota bacterium]|nr:aminopeptidase P family protein [Pseudomonadota bacterium]